MDHLHWKQQGRAPVRIYIKSNVKTEEKCAVICAVIKHQHKQLNNSH